MRFTPALVIGFALLALFQLLFLIRQPQELTWLLMALIAADTLLLLILLLADRSVVTHAFLLAVLFLTLLSLLLFGWGAPTFLTPVLSCLFILLFLLSIALVMIESLHDFALFDRMFASLHERQTTLPSYLTPGEDPDYPMIAVEEPPRIRLTETEEGEWIEIGAPRQAPKRIVRKTRATGRPEVRA